MATTKRVQFSVKISPPADDYLLKLATQTDVDKSEVGRAMLTVAARHEREILKQIEQNKRQA